jgi:chemotaxis protein methyltransferase CheR
MKSDGDSLSNRDFLRLSSFIEGYSGIKMSSAKKVMVEGRLRRRVRALGLSSLDAYCRALFDEGKLEK